MSARHSNRILVLLMGAATFVGATAHADAQVAVTAADLGVSWFKADNRAPGTGAFVFGPATPPAGQGSYELATPAGDPPTVGSAKIQLLTRLHSGTRLADIDGLGYSTYRAAAPANSPALPALNLRVDRDTDGIVDTYLVFEPYVAYGNAAVQSGVWQHWDAFNGGAAKWWVSHIPACGQSTPCTWNTIIGMFPNARILEDPDAPVNSASAPTPLLDGSFGVNQGSNNPGVLAYVDLLTISVHGTQTVYDFEPQAPQTVVVSNVTANGWGFLEETPAGSGQFVAGPPAAPAGAGSAELTVNGTGGELLGVAAYAGVKLADITKLQYSTYRTTGASVLALSLQFNVDYDVADANVGWQGRLVFEPYQMLPSPTIVDGAWQTWNPLAGRWWATGLPGRAVCPQSAPCTWTVVRKTWPRAVTHPSLAGVGFKAGGGWSTGFKGNVDRFLIAVNGTETTYDFEFLDVVPPVIDVCPASVQLLADAVTGTANAPDLVLGVTAHDDVTGVNQLAITQTPAAGTTFGVGAHPVTIRVADEAGNVSTCGSGFTVIDVTPPTILACTAPVSVRPGPNGQATLTDLTGGIVAIDNIGVASIAQSAAAGTLVGAGAHAVTFTVSDAAGFGATCQTTVTVASARSLTEDVLADLVALGATVTDRRTSRELDEAVAHLSRALTPAWWGDANHVDARRGERVFEEAREAVEELGELADARHAVIPKAALIGLIARIVEADRLLASVAIADAQAAALHPRRIAQANDELARGDSAAAAGRFLRALVRYRIAWRRVVRVN